ncbi:MAG: energy-coupling factor ABC transporter permease [Coriobacteriia bacterium]
MSHIHIPDGVLPLWLIAVGWIAAGALTALAVRRASNHDLRRRIPLVGAMAALMLVGMSSEIIPIAYHINLTVLAGILLGPWLSIITALIVNVMLALVGHGGVTVIGLNTLVIVAEMVVGWFLFGQFARVFGRRRPAVSAAGATVLALIVSTTLLVGIVALGGSPAATRESGAFNPATLSFANPFGGGVVTNVIVAPQAEQPAPKLPVARFAIMVYLLGSVGWLIEALITALIVGFVARVRPGLVFEGASAEPVRAPLGDEGTHT